MWPSIDCKLSCCRIAKKILSLLPGTGVEQDGEIEGYLRRNPMRRKERADHAKAWRDRRQVASHASKRQARWEADTTSSSISVNARRICGDRTPPEGEGAGEHLPGNVIVHAALPTACQVGRASKREEDKKAADLRPAAF